MLNLFLIFVVTFTGREVTAANCIECEGIYWYDEFVDEIDDMPGVGNSEKCFLGQLITSVKVAHIQTV